MKKLVILACAALAMGTLAANRVLAHGDMAPSPVDTTGLDPLGEEWRPNNPYRGNAKAIEIGARGYNSNCARCHGLDVKSGGMAPDLRQLESTDEGDAWFLMRIRGGAKRDDRVKMPPFEGILSQEAMWAIRSYIESRPKDQ
jgi:cytochrome c-550 PedF